MNQIEYFEDANENLLNQIVMGLNFLQKMVLSLYGYLKVGYLMMVGWNEKLPLFLFKCPVHGYQINYQTGFNNILYCPKCLKEETPEASKM